MTQPASTPTDTAAQHDNASRHPVSGTFPATNSFIPALEELADEFREWELEMRRSGRCDADVAVCKQLTQRLFREVDAVERLVRGGDLDMGPFFRAKLPCWANQRTPSEIGSVRGGKVTQIFVSVRSEPRCTVCAVRKLALGRVDRNSSGSRLRPRGVTIGMLAPAPTYGGAYGQV